MYLIVVIRLSLSETENESLQLKKVFDQNGPLVQVILDGTGIGTDDPNRNPVVKANSTYFQKLVRDASSEGLFMKLRASSEAVGLPPLNNGNSEAGHMTMGALKIYSQNTKLVDEAIESGSILRTEAWKDIVIDPSRQNKTIHFTGLLSDGNCFSHINHLFKLLEAVASSGAKRLRVHATLDGVYMQTLGLVFIEKLEKKLAMLRKDGIDAQISSGGGRAYTSIVKRLFPEGDDTKNLPFVIVDKNTRQPVGKIEDGDSVINYNYREDYQMMITEAFEAGSNARVPHILSENDPRAKDVKYASLMQYDSAANIPRRFFVEGTMISNVLMDCVIGGTVGPFKRGRDGAHPPRSRHGAVKLRQS